MKPRQIYTSDQDPYLLPQALHELYKWAIDMKKYVNIKDWNHLITLLKSFIEIEKELPQNLEERYEFLRVL